jgi:hypothetical protein
MFTYLEFKITHKIDTLRCADVCWAAAASCSKLCCVQTVLRTALLRDSHCSSACVRVHVLLRPSAQWLLLAVVASATVTDFGTVRAYTDCCVACLRFSDSACATSQPHVIADVTTDITADATADITADVLQVASAEARLSPHGHGHEGHGGGHDSSSAEGLAGTFSRTVARARGKRQAHKQQQQPRHGSSPDNNGHNGRNASLSEGGGGSEYASDGASDFEADVSGSGASLLGGLSLLNSHALGGGAAGGGLRNSPPQHSPQNGLQNGHTPTAGGSRPGMLNGRLSPRAGAKVAPLSAPASPTTAAAAAAAAAAASGSSSSATGSPRHGSGGSSVKAFGSTDSAELELRSLKSKAASAVHLQDMDSSIREEEDETARSSNKLLLHQLSSAGADDASRQERTFTDSTTDSNSSGRRRLSAAEDVEAGAPLKGKGLVAILLPLLLLVIVKAVSRQACSACFKLLSKEHRGRPCTCGTCSSTSSSTCS